VHPHRIRPRGFAAFHELTTNWRLSDTDEKLTIETSPDQVSVYPLIQAGQFDIRNEEGFLRRLLSYSPHAPDSTKSEHSAEKPLMNLTTGYFNLHKPYQRLLLENPYMNAQVLVAAPLVCSLRYLTHYLSHLVSYFTLLN
jgi:CDP-diacylglycerol--glycerol-3-phosphate 3-phosphatidyltransferase